MIKVQIVDTKKRIEPWHTLMARVPSIGDHICHTYNTFPVWRIEWWENRHTKDSGLTDEWQAIIYVDTQSMK